MSEVYQPIDSKAAVLAFNEGVEAMENGDEQAAVGAWQRTLKLDPGVVLAAVNLVTYYQKVGDLAGELHFWNYVISYDPFDTDQLILQAAALRKAGRRQEAIDNYRRAIAIYPYFKFWYHELAGILAELGNDRDAAVWHQRGDSLQADEAEICFEDGARHAEAGRWDSARTHFEAVLDDFPANLDARLRLAEALEKCQQPEEALKQYQQATELTEVGRGLVYYRMGQFHLRLGERDKARAAFESALATSPRFYMASRAIQTIVESERRDQPVRAIPSTVPSPADRMPAWGEAPAQFRKPIILNPPDPRLPWQHQLRLILDQALSLPDPAGLHPRMAVAFEPGTDLSGVVPHVLAELRASGHPLRADGQESHIYLIQAGGATEGGAGAGVNGGWLGREPTPAIDGDRRGPRYSPIPLTQLLESIRVAGGQRGFSCLILVSAGRLRPETADPREAAKTLPLHGVCFIHPAYHYVDTRLALQGSVSNFLDVSL